MGFCFWGSITEAIFGAGVGWVSGLFGLIVFRDAARGADETPKVNDPKQTSTPTINHAKPEPTISKSTQFKNEEYPETPQPSKPIINDWLKEGNIRCAVCKKQDLPENFLESTAGSNFKKCPSCNTNFQFKEERKSFGVNIPSMSCPRCNKPGSSSSFLKSDAGKDYAQCPECGMNFHI